MYLDTAENRAKRHIPMKMEDWIKSVEDIFKINFYDNLTNKGTISHKEAVDKAENEYEKYIQSIDATSSILLKEQIQRIEQGMGRGVRANSDSCCIVLMDEIGRASCRERVLSHV